MTPSTTVTTTRRTDYLQQVFGRFCVAPPEYILDIGCGTGNHSQTLAAKGFHVTGIDSSPGQIRLAQAKPPDASLSGTLEFVVADMRDFALGKPFDVAFSFFGPMNYLVTDEDLEQALNTIHRHLRDQGLLVFDFWSLGGVIPRASSGGHQSWSKAEADDQTIIRLAQSVFDPDACALEITFDFYVLSQGKVVDEFQEVHRLRVFSLGEIRSWLRRTGFEVVGMFDHLTFDSPKSNTFQPKVVARKQET